LADKSINDLNFAPGTIDDANTLFVVAQSGTAYKVSGHDYITALGVILDGHGGIKTISYTDPVAPSLDGTLTITLADDSVETITITNGKGFASSSPVVDYWARSTSNSTVPSTWYTTMQTLTSTYKYLWHYQHYAFNDGTSFDTTKTVIGVYGDTGDNAYIWIRYASECSGTPPLPPSDSDMGTVPDNWIGIYTGTASTAPTTRGSYTWYLYKGETGDTGAAATIVTQNVSYQTSNSGTVAPSGSWTSNVPTVTPGDFLWTRTQIQFNSGNPIVSYSVSRYGIDGSGAVVTVNNVSPDANGNVALAASNIPMSDNTSVQTSVSNLQTDLGKSVLKATSAVTPTTTQATYTLTGLTNKHELVRWNFVNSGNPVAENNPPVDLTWVTDTDAWKITSGSATTVTIQPVFALPSNA
jgi:hypothetical protein